MNIFFLILKFKCDLSNVVEFYKIFKQLITSEKLFKIVIWSKMNRYSTEELADIHFIYGYCNGNGRQAAREYATRYPNRRAPDHRLFQNVHRNLRERGQFNPRMDRAGNVSHHVDVDNNILDSVTQNPTTSTRRVGLQLGVSHAKVWRTLNADRRYPYHYTPVQELLLIDMPKRVIFCRQLLLNQERDPMYLSSILWTDEAQFTRDGVTNFHNLHEWQHENPHAKRQSSFQRRFSVNIWCGIIGNTVIGPTILPNRLNAQNYLQFLVENAPIILDEVPLNVINRVIYQQDGAPAHFGVNVRNWLDDNYPGRWIGRNEPIDWPPRSPDLTPLDFNVWGFLKEDVYAVQIDSYEQLIHRIENAIEKLRENLQNFVMINAIEKRLQLCLMTNGNHFENLL